MESINTINNFLNHIDENKIYFRLNKIRPVSIMVEVTVPGQRWEIEFMEDGTVEIEKFNSNGSIYDEGELNTLFNEFFD